MGVEFDPDCHSRNPPSQAGSRPAKQSQAAAWGSCCGGDWTGYNVFRNAMSCWRSSGLRFSPKVWPGIALASVPSGLNPPGI